MELKRLLTAGVIAGVLIVGATAQGVKPQSKPSPGKEIATFSGEMTLTTGFARLPDGTYRSVEGMKIPFKAERIKVGPSTNPLPPLPLAGEAYRNDTNGGYFWSGPEFPMPSALDDCSLTSAGRGQPWTRMTVGYHAGSTQRILLRWIVFDTFVSGRGAGVSAVEDVVADWGGYFTFQQVGDWKITFDFTIVGVSVNDGVFWLASQIREPVPTGEGAFRQDFWPMFSGRGVDIGSSADWFYYDNSPLDGIYDELEYDQFGGAPDGLANLLLTIETGGTVTEVSPISFTTNAGILLGGNFFDLWYVDNLTVRHRVSTASESVYPIIVVVDGLAPPQTITSLKFNLDAWINLAGGNVKVDLFNFVTNQWVTIHAGPAPTSWVPRSWTLGANPSHYVGPSRQLRARISYQVTSFESVTPLRSWIDRATWIVGRA